MLPALVGNIRDGTRLALFRDVDYDEFTVDYLQLAALLAVGLLLSVAAYQFLAVTDPKAMAVGWSRALLDYMSALAGAAVIALLQRAADRIVGFLVVLSAASTLLMFLFLVFSALIAAVETVMPVAGDAPHLGLGLSAAGAILLLGLVVSAFSFVISYRAIRCAFNVGAGRALLLFIILTIVSLAPGVTLEALT